MFSLVSNDKRVSSGKAHLTIQTGAEQLFDARINKRSAAFIMTDFKQFPTHSFFFTVSLLFSGEQTALCGSTITSSCMLNAF